MILMYIFSVHFSDDFGFNLVFDALKQGVQRHD